MLKGLESRDICNQSSKPTRKYSEKKKLPPLLQSSLHKYKQSKSVMRNSLFPFPLSQEQKYKLFFKFVCISNYLQMPNYFNNKRNTVFIGSGNNNYLIKQMFERRFWWRIIDKIDEADLVWSQQWCGKFANYLTDKKFKQSKLSDLAFAQTSSKEGGSYLSQNLQKLFLGQIIPKVSMESLKSISRQNLSPITQPKMHNHIQFIGHITNKKQMTHNLKVKQFDQTFFNTYGKVCTFIPRTLCWSGQSSLREYFSEGMFIIKPGENSNRGNGITIANSLDQVVALVNQYKNRNSLLVQQYIQPLLYYKRKFDIRAFLLFVLKGMLKGYWYEEGYIRTCGKQYQLSKLDIFAHLTNDAIQKHSNTYGKYQPANKLTWTLIEKYLKHKYNFSFHRKIVPRMKRIAKELLLATFDKVGTKRKEFTFELIGLDFLIGENEKVWLIEANSNPSLQTPCIMQSRLLGGLVSNVLGLAVDPVFVGPSESCKSRFLEGVQENRFELIFDEFE